MHASIDEVNAKLLPRDEADAVQKLIARYGAVALTGDGVNDPRPG